MAERLRSMTDAELGAALSSLEVAFPETSTDLAALAVARIRAGEATTPARRSLRDRVAGLVPPRGVRRVLVIALLVVALTSVAAGAAFLGVRGVQIVFDNGGPTPTASATGSTGTSAPASPSPSPTLPGLGDTLELGEPSTLEAARAGVDFDVAVPPEVPGLGEPRVFLVEAPYLPRASFVWVENGEPKLFLTEFKAHPWKPYLEKIVFAGGTVDRVDVNGETGYWLSGAAHELDYVDEDDLHFNDRERLVGNALVWTRGPVTLRLEGAATLDEALSIARATT
jgi:hypothetical protein